MSETGDRGRSDFFAEAEELVDGLFRSLDQLEDARRSDDAGVEASGLLNELFRGVHTLKGLAGIFGASKLSALTHELEGLLDDARLGRAAIDETLLGQLQLALSFVPRLLRAEKDASPISSSELDAVLGELRGAPASAKGADALATLDLSADVFSVLTEYEEHRLRVNIEAGLSLFRLTVSFALLTIDESLDALKTSAKPLGEIITYLPTGEGADADSIELDILLASKRSRAELATAFPEAAVNEVGQKRAAEGRAKSSAPAASGAMTPVVAASPVAPEAPVALDRGGGESLRSMNQSVRVDIHKLDALMNVVGDLSILKTSLDGIFERLRASTDRASQTELSRLSRSFGRQLESMQQRILEVRMVPLGQLFERLARVARQVGRDMGKEVHLVVTGAETEIDKLLAEELSDPLMHMMRNAIDHGIELAESRLAVGKPQAGTIALNAFQKGNHVVIELEDDGAGIDTERLLELGLARGVVDPADVRSTSRREVLALIFVPGLSTKSEPGRISGRGVGMDVVKTNIAKLGGVIDVQSELGIGTKLTLTLPITLAVIRVLLAEVGGQVFAIPLANVREAVPLDDADRLEIDGHEAMSLRGATLRLCRLAQVFDLEPPKSGPRSTRGRLVVVAVAGSSRLGLVVDRLLGTRDVVMKPLGASLSKLRGFAGAAELGDERLGLVLDTPQLLEESMATDRRGRGSLRSAS